LDERKYPKWEGGKEWKGPDDPNAKINNKRIVEKDGQWGWSDNHWDDIYDFDDNTCPKYPNKKKKKK
jgi:hypothetical protein